MQNRDLFSFDISKHVRLRLIKNNFCSVDDFEGITASKLSSEMSLSLEECEKVLSCIRGSPEFPPISAVCLLRIECSLRAVSTSSKQIDQLLNGGVHLKRITEFCGQPGAGKTQMCLQLSINAQLSSCYKNGTKGEVIYIDTEGSFTLERLFDMAKSATDVTRKRKAPGDSEPQVSMSIDELTKGVHYTRCSSFKVLSEKINGLSQFLTNHQQVRLVIIDNITNPIRVKFESEFNERNAVLQHMVLTLLKLAKKHEFAVVITNQMTTRIVNEDETYIVPALGAHWSHSICNRILLQYNGPIERWSAKLVKSPYGSVDKCVFDIQGSGICDITST